MHCLASYIFMPLDLGLGTSRYYIDILAINFKSSHDLINSTLLIIEKNNINIIDAEILPWKLFISDRAEQPIKTSLFQSRSGTMTVLEICEPRPRVMGHLTQDQLCYSIIAHSKDIDIP